MVHEGVAEHESTSADAHNQSRCLGRLEGLEHGLGIDVEGESQKVEVELPADDSRHDKDRLDLVAESGHSAPYDLEHALGKACFLDPTTHQPAAALRQGHGAGFVQVEDQFPSEERVPVGLPVHRVHEVQLCA